MLPRAVILGLAAFLALAAPAAAARQKPVTGTLVNFDFAVVAVAYDGKVSRTGGFSERFKLVPTAKRFTLHLRDNTGKYRGPIVAPGRKRGTVVTGFKAGAKLGKIRLKNGYAVTKKLPASALDARRTARASARGVPLGGAGNLGLVRAPAVGSGGLGRDPDRDALPGTLDVDDDGDLVLDDVEAVAGTATHSAADPVHPIWLINLNLGLTYIAERDGMARNVGGFALNRNARNTASDDGAFDRASALTMGARGLLLFPIPGPGARLSCTGVSWCGRARNLRENKFFPADFSPVTVRDPSSGRDLEFGLMEPVGVFNPINDGIGTSQQLDPARIFGLKPGVDRTQLDPNHQFFVRSADGTINTVLVGTIFATVPALAAWSDGGGTAKSITYPVPANSRGTAENPEFVKPSPDGDYRLTLSVWRPQRPPELTGETDWIDRGLHDYEVSGRTLQNPPQVWRCPTRHHDTLGDTPVNPANVVTFTVNISDCLRSSGMPAWGTGQPASEIYVAAKSLAGDAAEGVGFAFRPAGDGQPSSSGNFSGVWRRSGDTVEWTIRANQFATDHFRLRVNGGYAITAGSTPSGFNCEKQTIATPDDVWQCSGGTFAPGSDLSGTLQVSGSGKLSVELIAPSTQGGGFQSDTGYPMAEQP